MLRGGRSGDEETQPLIERLFETTLHDLSTGQRSDQGHRTQHARRSMVVRWPARSPSSSSTTRGRPGNGLA